MVYHFPGEIKMRILFSFVLILVLVPGAFVLAQDTTAGEEAIEAMA